MNRKNLQLKLSFLVAPLLLIIMLVISCDKDEPTTSDPDGMTEEPDDPGDGNGGDHGSGDPGPTTGTITFEDGFTLDEDRRFTNLILSEVDYNSYLDETGNVQDITKKVYEYFDDDFDFIIILSNEADQPPGLYFGRHTPAKLDVQGLGGNTYNNTQAFGSTATLKGVLHMPRTRYIRNGPFLHEIVHYWANKNFIPTTVGGHWGFSSAGGQLGGFSTLTSLGNNTYQASMSGSNNFGTFANGGNSVPYGNVELYLMGLITTDELEDLQVAENPERTTNAGEFTATAITTYTAEDLITTHGERIPNSQDSQKDFNGLVVVISKAVLTDDEITSLNDDLENFTRAAAPDANTWGNSSNFWRATGGRASFNVTVVDGNIKGN
ncbi:hypothetical protein [Spongiivirga citrea]|uniref:Uncharacterized protein n=1 Tax=Spongiivirga citrea TaxID=1481457 RepID=A0A6M0CPB9_9FLAO|nr:hypothetical protein [Spongiivirga citrea]NER17317.1 hypothetical protein [Spongiivirga citrea]